MAPYYLTRSGAERILLPTDGTELCECAIRHGIALAKLADAQVIGVTVTQPLHSAVPRSMIPKDIAGIIHSETVKLADENSPWSKGLPAKQACRSRLSDKATITPGSHCPHGQGQELRPDRHGLHGRRGVSVLVLGIERHKVLTHSTVPVLVVR
jgi:nucleotide-binding universal stress UspA family protein